MNDQPPSLIFRAKRRLMLLCQNVLDRIVAQVENFGGKEKTNSK
jgi:hypothetical protein